MKLIMSVLMLVLSLDQVSKYIISESCIVGKTIPVFENFFHITLIYNKGVAFGLFNDNAVVAKLLVFFGCSVVAYMLFAMRSLSVANRVAAGMMIGGALGNIVDRIRIGAVVDFLDFRVWPVFNIADTFISIAAGMFIILILVTKNEDEKNE